MTALVFFEVAGVCAAVPAADVLEVVAVRDVTAVPAAPDFLAGVLAHRGAVVPLVDGAEFLGGRLEPRPRARALLLGTGLGPVALTIDRVLDVGDGAGGDHVRLDVEALVRDCRNAIAARGDSGVAERQGIELGVAERRGTELGVAERQGTELGVAERRGTES